MRLPESLVVTGRMSSAVLGEGRGEGVSVSARALPRWSRGDHDALPNTDYPQGLYSPNHTSSPFLYNPDINDRLALWHGDISLLEADAIVNTTSESLDERNPISDKIFARAGSSLKEEIHNDDKDCRTGDVCVTSAHELHARYIIHTVGPIYNPKYHMASENSLHMCYRNILFKAQSLGVQTLALCVVNTAKRNFPPDVAAHIALRTIRRFLEENSTPWLIVLCSGSAAEASLFEALAPLYFPRGEREQEGARWRLPTDTGEQLGAPQQPPERRIRIIDNPHHTRNNNADDDVSLDIGYSDTEEWSGDESRKEDTVSRGDLAAAAAATLGGTGAARFAGDRQRLLGPAPPRYPPLADIMTRQIESEERYDRLLRRARSEDLSEVSGIGCLYQSGVDRLGRPVIVFVGKWLPVSTIDLDKALLYLILLLDPIVRGDYVIAYFHTLASANNYPPFSWLKEVYSLLPYKYKKNLKAFYIVHPTFWTKMMTWWFTTFMAPAIKQKVHNLPGVEYLYSVMSRDQLEIPAFITEYDMTINGLHYFQPDVNNST